MALRIAIHESPVTFSDRWIEICREKRLDFDCVNGYQTDILRTLRGYDLFLWHWHIWEPVSILIAPQILSSAESMGLHVWPEANTCRFYNDKIYQKYLLDAVEAPAIPTAIFYDLKAALEWIETATFPKVLKLRCGRRSNNVKLIADRDEAVRVCKTAFREGFYRESMDEGFCYPDYHLGEAFHSNRLAFDNRRMGAAAYGRMLTKRFLKNLRHPSKFWEIVTQRERGYVYFQEYLPGNSFDTRIVVIGDRAFGCVRDNRDEDFRASGGGRVDYDVRRVDLRCVRVAFETVKKLGVQSLALDFILDADKNPCIAEINYNFSTGLVNKCQGHWDTEMNWYAGHSRAEDAILADLISAASDS